MALFGKHESELLRIVLPTMFTVPVEVTDMPDRVVWLPANSAGCAARRELAAGHGSRVTIRPAGEIISGSGRAE